VDGHRLGLPASTVGRVLGRHQVPLLRECDPLTGVPIRASRRTANRYEHPCPGSLVHIDVKKLGRIPDGHAWKANGRDQRPHYKRGLGYDYVHTAIDDYIRLAYAGIHDDEKGTTCAGFRTRAIAFYASHGVTVERVISDNGRNYRLSRDFLTTAEHLGVRLELIKPYCHWTNGKIERLNRTLAAEWAYSRVFDSNAERAALLPTWLEHYNLNRPHLGISGQRPIDRLNNAAGQYS
jgi:transposase InsO family protein